MFHTLLKKQNGASKLTFTFTKYSFCTLDLQEMPLFCGITQVCCKSIAILDFIIASFLFESIFMYVPEMAMQKPKSK